MPRDRKPPAVEHRLPLLPGWAERLAEEEQQRQLRARPQRIIPLSPGCFSGKLTLVEDLAGAQSLIDFARQRPLSFVGVDCEFRHSRAGVPVKKDHTWQDPRSIMPLLMGMALVEPQAGGQQVVYRFVVDLRRPEVLGPLGRLFKLPLPFVAHFFQAEVFCLWQLGLPEPDRVWDTWAAERALLLGIYHARYQNEKPADEAEEARAEEEADEQVAFSCKLVSACLRRGVPYPFAGDKERLQKSFLTHPAGQPFSHEQLDYAAADAEAAARLYPAQVLASVAAGCLDHLTTVEMPWAVTNAGMVWDGVRLDAARCRALQECCRGHVVKLSAELAELGVGNVNSHKQLLTFFRGLGLLDAFRVGGKYTCDDDHLEAVEHRHPAIPAIRELRKVLRLLKDKILTGELVGADGRLHPEHRQLGAETGRNSMSWPNVGGIGRALRPLVVPEPGCLIGEVDLSQIEVGIAAAVYGDPDLIKMFNGRDVYTAMAKRYYAGELPPAAQTMPDKDFKKKYRNLRDRMKVFTLATIYNITPFGLSLRLDITVERAAAEQAQFLAMFPALALALREASEIGAIRGCAYLCSGLRRWRARTGTPSSWEVNWMRNTPVQGSAGVVFKAAGNRLRRRFLHYKAKLILPMHDAFVFEALRQHFQVVAKITAEVMRGTVQEYFPELDPQVEINISHPHCWNKDGKYRSLAMWMAKPALARRYM
jgi:DNA polymerase-1